MSNFEEDKFIIINRKRFEELAAIAVKSENKYQIKYAARCIQNLEDAIISFQEMYEEKVGRKMDQKYFTCNQDESYAQEVINLILTNGEKIMSSELKNYRKKNVQPMRPYVEGEDLSGVSVSPEDEKLDTLVGGMIAVSASNPDDKWYVAKVFFEENYIEA